jgi:hypothetical protein
LLNIQHTIDQVLPDCEWTTSSNLWPST